MKPSRLLKAVALFVITYTGDVAAAPQKRKDNEGVTPKVSPYDEFNSAHYCNSMRELLRTKVYDNWRHQKESDLESSIKDFLRKACPDETEVAASKPYHVKF